MTSLRILGPVQVWRDGERLVLGGPRQTQLLSFLVLNANRAVSRDSLIEGVWGSERGDARSRLQMAIARLRKALEPLDADPTSRLQTVTGGYLLSVAPGELDADVFQAGVLAGLRALDGGQPAEATKALSQAMALWRGPPLAEVAFEDFAQAEIRRLNELWIRARESRIDAELQMGRHADVIGELESLLAEAPTREHVAAQLMLALYRSGRQADALEVYQRARTALSAELGIEPGPALRQLHQEILEQAPTLASPAASATGQAPRVPEAGQLPLPVRLQPEGSSAFAGRAGELATLERALGETSSSGRRAAVVTGEAGIGKTRLVSEFARNAHADGTLVLAGRCDDGLNLPYQPFVEALEHLVTFADTQLLERHVAEYGDSIGRLVPTLLARTARAPEAAGQPSDSERYVLFRAVEGLLAAACAVRPVVLVLEDLHWADLPTLHLLRRLLTSPRQWSLMLVLTCRADDLWDHDPLRELLADLHREPRVARLDLRGLDSSDVVDLLEGVGAGKADVGLAAALTAGTNGNPFFITELARSLLESGAMVDHDGVLRTSEPAEVTAELPVSIAETLGRRLERLPVDVRRCLDAASVIGEEFDLELLAKIVDAPSVESSTATATRAGVIVAVPGGDMRLRFSHALMHRYVYRQLSPARRTELHRRIALALERRLQTGASQAAELAQHWVEAVDSELKTALRYSVMAGDEALEKLAPDEARRWYDCALELLGRRPRSSDAQRCDLLIKRGGAERQAGDRRFRETLLEAAGIAQSIGDDDNLVRAVLQNTRGMQSETGVVDQGRLATLASALHAVGEADSSQRARLLAMQAAELMYSQEWERRVALSDEALAISRRLDDADALSAVLNMRFVTLLAPETLGERQSNTGEAVAVAEQLSDPLARFFAYHWRAYACIEAGDVLSARSWAVREQDIADRYRQPTTLWLRCADEANLAIIAGNLDLADTLAGSALEIGQQSEPDALTCYAAQKTSVAFERGGMGELVPMLQQAARDNPGVPGFRATLALALSESGQPDEARALIEPVAASGFAELPYDVTWLTVMCLYAHVAATLGDPLAAAALYQLLEPWAEQIAFPAFGVWGPVGLYLGPLARVLGEPAAARQHLLGAARAAVRAGAPLWEARAAAELAR